MDPTFEICWGRRQGVALPELIDIAGAARFAALTIPPELYFLSRRDGFRDAVLRGLLHELVAVGVRPPGWRLGHDQLVFDRGQTSERPAFGGGGRSSRST